MWSGKFLARAVRLVYNIILMGTVKYLADNTEQKTKEYSIIKKLNKNAYNNLVWAQDNTVRFQFVEELVTKNLPNGIYLR